jgi:hypothetical protein
MKTIFKISVAAVVLSSMLVADLPFLPVQAVPEAQAIFGVWRRHARRWAVVGTAAVATTAAATTAAAASETAAAQQQAAAAQQQAASAQQQTAAAQQQAAPAPPAAGKQLPIGTVVSALPSGCVSTPVGGVEYYYCGGNFYRAVFQGNQLVYVTAQPK